MLHALPITNVRLDACHENWAQMTPTARGRHCQRCNHEVIDFTQATLLELLWAQAAAPEGQLCGRFRADQLAAAAPTLPPLRLRPKLRWFLVAALLVVVQGFSAQQAVAQVRRPPLPAVRRVMGPPRPARRKVVYPTVVVAPPVDNLLPTAELQGGVDGFREEVVEVGPYPGLSLQTLMYYVQQNLQYPTTGTSVAQVQVRFMVDATGRVQEPLVARSAGPAFDTEALRVVRLLPQLPPPPQPQEVTLPIYFRP